MSSKSVKSHKDNIEIIIEIGQYKLQMSIPRETKVSTLLTIIKNYQKLHQTYAPVNSYFIGLCSKHKNPVIDYWLTQGELDFGRFKKKLELKALYSIDKWIEKLSINEFQFLKCLGKGACGEVYLVRNKVTGYLFAMKRLRKQNIKDYKALESIIRQKKILCLLPPNPHTVTFHGSFESQSHFNFLMDYYPGGQLFLHLVSDEEQNKLNQEEAKIYFCQILLAMEYLHRQKILYRDLKPQNILVDIQGHLKITDFGLSKCGFQEQQFAYSQCGSAQYMAPQILQQKSYNFSADFYSIGAILYELITGLPPYYGTDYNENQLLQQIKGMNLDFSKISSPYLQQLLENLLNPIPQLRLCNYQQIKNNPWLSNINWKEIQSKKSILKFAPNIYKTYIGEQFLALQEEVEQMNLEEKYDFQPLFQGLFNFVKQSSQKIVLGIRESNISKSCLQEIHFNKNSAKDHMSMKRKTAGFIKQKPKYTKHKPNYSIQLFDKDESTNSSHSHSTQNSNCSNLPYEPRTTRNLEIKNKENMVAFKKSTKKLMTINDTLSKITKQPSQKKLLTKQPSQGNLLKCSQPSQKIILRQPTTPIRLATCHNTHNESIQEKGILIKKQDLISKQTNRQSNQFSSKSKNCLTRQLSKKILRNSENFSSVKNNRSQLKSKPKSKSKSKQKLQLKARTKQNFSINVNNHGVISNQKAKLPTCTYKIKLM